MLFSIADEKVKFPEWMVFGSVVVKALCYKPEGRGFETQWGEFLNLPNPSGVYSATNRNEYRKHKNNNVSGE
jgi:hypothetical protein